jgi:hypothetical protein
MGDVIRHEVVDEACIYIYATLAWVVVHECEIGWRSAPAILIIYKAQHTSGDRDDAHSGDAASAAPVRGEWSGMLIPGAETKPIILPSYYSYSSARSMIHGGLRVVELHVILSGGGVGGLEAGGGLGVEGGSPRAVQCGVQRVHGCVDAHGGPGYG